MWPASSEQGPLSRLRRVGGPLTHHRLALNSSHAHLLRKTFVSWLLVLVLVLLVAWCWLAGCCAGRAEAYSFLFVSPYFSLTFWMRYFREFEQMN